MSINREKLQDIEDSFTRLKANDSDVSALRKMSDSLKSITGKTVVVDTVRPSSQNQECTVMSIYPDESTLDMIIQSIVSENDDNTIAKVWAGCSKWNIEIDTRILDNDANMNERELTALLLHEVGHMMFSLSVPSRLSKVVRLRFAKSHFVTKQLLKDNFFSKLMCFPILQSCNATNHIPVKNSVRHEVKADNFAIKAGYGKELESAMDKIIIYAGKDGFDKELDDLTGFSIDSITSLQDRQNHVVRKNMVKMIASTPSTFAKRYIGKISKSLSGSENGSVNESVKDEFIANRINEIVSSTYLGEGLFNRVHKMKRIDPADIDYIGLEIENIKSNDDKMMIVSYIYNKLDIIDYYIALIDSRNAKYSIPHSRESLVAMRERLDQYRKDAINRKLPEVEYGIKIQYPSGYEG